MWYVYKTRRRREEDTDGTSGLCLSSCCVYDERQLIRQHSCLIDNLAHEVILLTLNDRRHELAA
jgi:hypothetical protein